MGANCNAACDARSASAGDEGVDVGVGGRAVEHDRAVAEGDDALRAAPTVGQLVGGDDERGAVGVGAAEQLEQRVAAGAVEADERLVDEQQLERADEREGDGRLLAQAAAERRSAGRRRGRRGRARRAGRSACCSQSSAPCSRAMYSRCSQTLRSS